MNVFVVIPAYFEGTVVGEVVSSLRDLYPHTVVVVNDGSTDNTAEEARKAGAIVLHHVINRGQGAALQTGMEYALYQGADVIVHYDADGQFSPHDLPFMLEPILNNEADIVLGSRFLEGAKTNMPRSRRWLLKGALFVDYFFSGLPLSDVHNGFRALSRHAAQTIKLTQDRMAHASEILQEVQRHQLRYMERPVQVQYTDYSLQKGQGSLNSLRILRDLLWSGFER